LLWRQVVKERVRPFANGGRARQGIRSFVLDLRRPFKQFYLLIDYHR